MTNNLTQLRETTHTLLQQIEAQSPFRPGSLVANVRKCGKPNCHCAREGAAGHGPQWLLTRSVSGKTVSKRLATHQLAATREHLAAYRRFQELLHEYVEANVVLCDTLLETPEDSGLREAEKKGSRGL